MPRVEVVYACAARQFVVTLDLATGSTVADAVSQSGLPAKFPEIAGCGFGIHGQAVVPGQPLRAGDRVEIYRPLIADPKAARRERALRAMRPHRHR